MRLTLLFRRHELLNGLEKLTGAETRDGLLESPERGASSLLTQLGNDVKLDNIPVDVGHDDESGNQVNFPEIW